jgi:16S rRNA processing protein RimM
MGKLLHAHGVKGLALIRSYAESPADFIHAGSIFLRTRQGSLHQYRVSSITPHKGCYLMSLVNLDSREQIDSYKGSDILVDRNLLVRGEDEFFWFELIGLDVYLDSGFWLGRLDRIIPTKANDIYVVKKGKRELCVPATVDVVREIDLEENRMTVSDEGGILSLNEI